MLVQLTAAVLASLPHAIVINLDERLDRRAGIEAQLASAGWPSSHIHRLAATPHTHGALGCALSHTRALDLAISSGWGDWSVILEDDIRWRRPLRVAPALQEALAWAGAHNGSVILLSGIKRSVEQDAPAPTGAPALLRAAVNYQTTAAYAVHTSYLPTLRAAHARAAEALQALGEAADAEHSIDISWKPLQERDGWLRLHPLLADQAAGYSDIERAERDYQGLYGGWEEARERAQRGESPVLVVYDPPARGERM